MNLLEIERIIRRAGVKMAEGLYFYWPCTANNDMAEANLTVHLGAALIESGFIVTAEAHTHGSVKTHLDLLGLHPSFGTSIAFEFKRLYSTEQIIKLQSDIERIVKFQPQEKQYRDPRIKIKRRFGVVAGTTWNQRYADWWDSENAVDPTDSVLDKFASHIPDGQNSAWGTVILNHYIEGNSNERETQYFLYVIFQLE